VVYAGNGDVPSATDSANQNRTYAYDTFNRLSQATNTSTSPNQIYQYQYDRFDNRWQQNYTQGQGAGWPVSLSFNANNQISTSGYRYDAAGNVLMDNLNCYTYDGENRISSVAAVTPPGSGGCGAVTMSYVYGPDGKRVARVQNGAIVKQDYYDAAGHEIAETNGSGALQRAEIYAGARHLATWSGNATYFNHADWLGTERVRSNSSGTVCETITSLPFGDGMATSGNCGDPSPDHFTGKERDTESGLDMFGARYYASTVGRFMTPDWAAKPITVPYANFGNPQSLNLYSYVQNNPTTTADPDGHCWPLCDPTVFINSGFAIDDARQMLTKAFADTAKAVAADPKAGAVVGLTLFAGGVAADTGLAAEEDEPVGPAVQGQAESETEVPAGSQPQDVYIDPSKHPAAAGHAADAQAAGHPDVLTVERGGAAERRAQATAGVPTQPGTDRDEYPPAVTAEGGRGASVRNIPTSDNRGAGASVGQQIRKVPNGGRIRIRPAKKPKPDY